MFFKRDKKQKELPYGWSGNYKSWEEALGFTKGYGESGILDKVKAAALKVKNGEAAYERDSFVFEKSEYSWPLLTMLLKIAIENNKHLSLIDFGGSLGSSYFQHKKFLEFMPEIKWNVVEQKHFVEEGNNIFADGRLNFYENLEVCNQTEKPNLLLASSVLQYLQQPFATIKQILDLKIGYIILDRTAFIKSPDHRITVQRVPPHIYEASYPSWFFNLEKFISMFKDYELLAEFDNGIEEPVELEGMKGYWKGLIFKLR